MSALFALRATGGGGGGVTDHGALTGLADDDHGQYFRTDGTRGLSGDMDCESHDINNPGQIGGLDLPSAPGELAKKSGDLGTPTALNLANATGLPIAGIASLGTSVAAALATALNAASGLVGLNASGELPAVSGVNLTGLPGGGVIKAANYTLYTTTTSVAGTSWYAPGLACSITPVSGTTYVAALAFLNLGTSSSSYCAIARLSSNVAGGMTVGATAGLRTSAAVASALSTSQVTECTIFDVEPLVGNYATRTYDVEIASVNSGATAYINRTGGDANSSSVVRVVSGILLLNI